jgi:dCTP deaminase
MAFWTTEKLFEVLADKKLIPQYDPNRVKVGAYELSMGSEYFVTADADGKRQTTKQCLSPGEQFVIPPGQFALLITEESVNLPANVISFISIKASVKFRGLINISGFHVDPGFSGRLKFSVQNAGSQHAVIAQGQALFLIWFSNLDRTTAYPYNGEHNNQMEITAKDVEQISGEIASPGQLLRDIVELRTESERQHTDLQERITLLNSRMSNAVWFFAIPLVVGIVLMVLQAYFQKSPQPLVVNVSASQGKEPATPQLSGSPTNIVTGDADAAPASNTQLTKKDSKKTSAPRPTK